MNDEETEEDKQENIFKELNPKKNIQTIHIYEPALPFYFTSLEKAKKYIKDLYSTGLDINCRYENNETYAHHAFGLDTNYLFRKSNSRVEVELVKQKKKDKEESDYLLPPKEYLSLQTELIKLLLSQPGIDLTTQDNQGHIPFYNFINSITKPGKTAEQLSAQHNYFPEIFHAIIDHGHEPLFKNCMRLINPEEISSPASIPPDYNYLKKYFASPFPFYQSLMNTQDCQQAQTFIDDVLSKQEKGINAKDSAGMTYLHYLLSLQGNLLFGKHKRTLGFVCELFKYICNTYKLDFSLKDNRERTAVDCFLSSLPGLTLQQNDSRTPPSSPKEKSSVKSQSVLLKSTPTTLKPVNPLFALFEQLSLSCSPDILKASFFRLSQSDQLIVRPLVHQFPIFVTVAEVEKIVSNPEERITLKARDPDGHTYLHHLIYSGKKYALENDTIENRLSLTLLLLEQLKLRNSKRKLLGFFIDKLPADLNDSRKQHIKSLLVKLADKIDSGGCIDVVDQSTTDNLHSFQACLLFELLIHSLPEHLGNAHIEPIRLLLLRLSRQINSQERIQMLNILIEEQLNSLRITLLLECLIDMLPEKFDQEKLASADKDIIKLLFRFLQQATLEQNTDLLDKSIKKSLHSLPKTLLLELFIDSLPTNSDNSHRDSVKSLLVRFSQPLLFDRQINIIDDATKRLLNPSHATLLVEHLIHSLPENFDKSQRELLKSLLLRLSRQIAVDHRINMFNKLAQESLNSLRAILLLELLIDSISIIDSSNKGNIKDALLALSRFLTAHEKVALFNSVDYDRLKSLRTLLLSRDNEPGRQELFNIIAVRLTLPPNHSLTIAK